MQEYVVQGEETLLNHHFTVKEARVRLGSEETAIEITRLSVEVKDAVALLVHDTQRDEFILVRQFRYPTLRYGMPFVLEAIAGEIEPDELPDNAARREVEEEIGYRVQTPIPIAKFFGSCGKLSELVHVFYAMVTDADRVGDGRYDRDEQIEIVRLPITEALKLTETPQPMDAKLLVPLLWFRSTSREP